MPTAKKKPARKKSVTRQGLTVTEKHDRRWWPWMIAGYIPLIIVLAIGFATLRNDQAEIERLQEFDTLRSYDLCVSGNERSEIISNAIKKVAQDGADALAQASLANDPPKTPQERAEFDRKVAEYKADIGRRTEASLEDLRPRDCEKLYPGEGGN